MLLGYLLHKNDLPKTIERAIGIIEDVEHHIALTAIKTIRDMRLQLPYTTQLLLKG